MEPHACTERSEDTHERVGHPDELRRARPPAARHHLLRRRPRDHRRLGRGRVDDHRDRRGQGARRRGARRVPDAGQPARRDPARSSPCSPASPTRWWPRPRRSTRRCRPSSSSPRAACWSRTTRRSTSASSSTSPAAQGRPWPGFEVLDTARLARRVVTRDDAPNCKLSSLADRLRRDDHAQPPRARRRTRHRRRAARPDGAARRARRAHARGAADLQLPGQSRHAPQAPPRRAPAALPRRLPVQGRRRAGCSTSARRATCAPGCAPTSPPPRAARGWARWSTSPTSVTGIECATPLEARVRELRLIAAHKPRYNKRSRFPEKVIWLKLTVEPWPRLSLVREVVDDGADYLGPFASRRTAEKCLAALHEAFPIRQCSDRLPIVPTGSAVRAGRDGPVPVARATAASTSTTTPPSSPRSAPTCSQRADDGRRDADRAHGPTRRPTSASRRPASTATGSRPSSAPPSRTQRLGALSSCAELVAARREDDRRWAVHVVRSGRLAASGVIPGDAHAGCLGHASCASPPRRWPAARVRPPPRPPRSPSRSCAGSSSRACGWCTSTASGPAPSAAPLATSPSTTQVEQSRAALVPFDERRALGTVHQP